jgi:hypothetical protein
MVRDRLYTFGRNMTEVTILGNTPICPVIDDADFDPLSDNCKLSSIISFFVISVL